MKAPIDLLKQLVENRRAWRLTLAAIIVIPIVLVLPHARSLVVRNAVTTTTLFSLKAPISGHVAAIDVMAGSVTREGETLIALRNDRVDGSRVARLEVLRSRLQDEVGQLRAQLDSVRALALTRKAEYASNVKSVTQDLSSQIKALNDRASARSAALREAEGNVGRVRRLYEGELLSLSDVEAAEALYENAKAEHSEVELERARVTERFDEIQSGVFQVNIPEGVLMTRQASQELDLEVMRLERSLAASEANLQATVAETELARQSFRNQAAADLTLPPGKTIWRVHATPGAWANEGSSLLTFVDCSRLMLDIAVDDATLELIEPGDKVNLRLFGSYDYRTASVTLVRGSAALRSDAPVLAAEVENRGQRKGRVLAALDPSSLADMPASSCAIGRTAYAEFDDLNLFELLFLPLFR